MKVYTKLEGKLAVFNVETDDYEEAIKVVRDELGVKHKPVILACIEIKQIPTAV